MPGALRPADCVRRRAASTHLLTSMNDMTDAIERIVQMIEFAERLRFENVWDYSI